MLRRRLDPPTSRSHRADPIDPLSVVAQLAAVRSLAEEVALVGDLGDQLEQLTRSALQVTGFGCGRVVVREDGSWVGYGGAQCAMPPACPVCRDDELAALLADHPVLLDRVAEPGLTILADAPSPLAKVLVSPITVGPGRRVLLVLRSDDPDAEVDALTTELVGVLTARSAVAIEHGLATSTQRRLRARLARDRRRTEDLVQVLTHDLRSPLSTVSSAIASLRERGEAIPGALRDRLLAAAADQAARALRLADDVALSVASHEDELPMTGDRVDVLALVEEERARVAASAPDQEVVVDTVRRAAAAADPERTGQVLQNLVDNALKHGRPETPVRFTVRAQPGTITVDVTNGGAAIPPEDRERVFARGERGVDAGGRPGAGLGLHTARRLARAMGGDVRLLDSTDAGTTFRLALPAAEGPETAV